jgi:GTP-binding protein
MANRSELPKICFCGRPNVGKSSLFNRLLGRKKAIVLDQPGVTRDVYRTTVKWHGKDLELADLAGLEMLGAKGDARQNKKTEAEHTLQRLSAEAALKYLRGADLILFVADGRQPLMPADEELARIIRATGKPVLLVLSKIEGNVEDSAQAESAALGFGYGIPTSAEHDLGITRLKQTILQTLFPEIDLSLPEDEEPSLPQRKRSGESSGARLDETPRVERGTDREHPIRLGVYGRPNVGKSTLVNRLLGEQRMITSPIAGTTVDTVDTDFEQDGLFYRILDTAGIRRKSKTERGVEVLSVVQALKSIPQVDVALFLIDGFEGVTDQDEKIAGELIKAGKPVVLLVNKWDSCRGKKEDYAERLRKHLGFLDFAPILFISAERGEGLDSFGGLIDEILRQRMLQAPTGELNRFLEMVEGTNNPTGVRLYFANQTSKNPPTITIQVSDPKKVHFAYERYLKNELRNRYGWMGSPLKLIFRARKRSESKKDANPGRRGERG